ncbi:hypothetical protein [Chryseobacterium taklimakanense]|uniref:Uncharacterized protein n=1 Tax=Chryseobacterium taklimakanense TaxID=536441 RepID=A0A3G8WI24_9FLAO|nr:hypothetical protein [Chryseobacterium taklimakanense]AZI20825.1 hypothetical protein EIH08_09015 [Chryseobacterium taklimakanense]
MNIVDNSTKASTAFGMLITIFVNIGRETILQTVVLAAVGGMSSFLATMLLKHLILKFKKILRK